MDTMMKTREQLLEEGIQAMSRMTEEEMKAMLQVMSGMELGRQAAAQQQTADWNG